MGNAAIIDGSGILDIGRIGNQLPDHSSMGEDNDSLIGMVFDNFKDLVLVRPSSIVRTGKQRSEEMRI